MGFLMRIVVDINHPAHVHYFKNFIWEMERRGHSVLVTASRKDVSVELLTNYGFRFVDLGSYGISLLSKLINIAVMDLRMYRSVRSFRPDIFVGWGSIRAAHVSRLLRRPCINVDDTEHAVHEHILYAPFSSVICTSSCYRKNFGAKHIKYNSYEELAYLHPKYFTPDPSVLKLLQLGPNDKYTVMRFVSWDAVHDLGQTGLTIDVKRKAVREFERYGRVFIVSESPLPRELDKYGLNLPPEKVHDLLHYASLYFGEGATMAAEAALLGTPAIYVNTLRLGFLEELEERYGLVLNFSIGSPSERSRKALERALSLLAHEDSKERWRSQREKMLREKVDPTEFMVKLVEDYPHSVQNIKPSGGRHR